MYLGEYSSESDDEVDMLISLSLWCPLPFGAVSELSNGTSKVGGGWLVGRLARDNALAIVSSSSAIWQRCDSRSGCFLGLGGGVFELRDGLVVVVFLFGGGAGAGRLVDDWGFLGVAWTADMLLGLVVLGVDPGGAGAGRLRGIEQGGGGRGGGERDWLFTLTTSMYSSFNCVFIEDFPQSLSPLLDL